MKEKKCLEMKITQFIGVLNYLLYTENSPAYSQLLKNYSDLLLKIQKRIKIEEIEEGDFDSVESSFRILQEAPPRNTNLGMYIIERMQEIYEIQKKIIE